MQEACLVQSGGELSPILIFSNKKQNENPKLKLWKLNVRRKRKAIEASDYWLINRISLMLDEIT